MYNVTLQAEAQLAVQQQPGMNRSLADSEQYELVCIVYGRPM